LDFFLWSLGKINKQIYDQKGELYYPDAAAKKRAWLKQKKRLRAC